MSNSNSSSSSSSSIVKSNDNNDENAAAIPSDYKEFTIDDNSTNVRKNYLKFLMCYYKKIFVKNYNLKDAKQ